MNNLYTAILIVAVIVVTATAILLYLRRILLAITATRKQVVQSVEPKFIDVSIQANNLVDLAIEVWRLQKRLDKASSNIKEDQLKALQNSQSKLVRYLDRNDIKIVEYADQKYNEGMNLEVLTIEKNAELNETVIKETHEPAVLLKGKLIRKAKVILYEP